MEMTTLDVEARAKEARALTLKHPGTAEEIDTVLQVLGYDAPEVVAAGREFDRRDMQDRGDNLAERMLARKVVLATAAVIGWDGFSWKGEPRPYDAQFKEWLLSQPGFSWIVDQVHEFGGDRGSLFGEPPKA